MSHDKNQPILLGQGNLPADVSLGTFSGASTITVASGTNTNFTYIPGDSTTEVLDKDHPPERRRDLWERYMGNGDVHSCSKEFWEGICNLVEAECEEVRAAAYSEGYEDGAYEEAMGDDL